MSGRVDEWWAMYVSMHMCCEYVCSIARRTRRRERNGQMEARRHGWMDSVGRGERHLRFNLAVSLWKEGGGGVVSLRTERSLGVPRLS